MRADLESTILVVADVPGARHTLRNACESYPEAVRWRFGRVALFKGTELGAFLAYRLREKHGEDVAVARTAPLGDGSPACRRAKEAARAFENREHASTPYPKFATGTDYPRPEEMRRRAAFEDGAVGEGPTEGEPVRSTVGESDRR